MPQHLQQKLLRTLQPQKDGFLHVWRLGATKSRPVRLHVICATNEPLEQKVADGRFNLALFNRLNGARIELPPLRDGTEDIQILVEYFIRKHGGGRATLDDGAKRV